MSQSTTTPTAICRIREVPPAEVDVYFGVRYARRREAQGRHMPPLSVAKRARRCGGIGTRGPRYNGQECPLPSLQNDKNESARGRAYRVAMLQKVNGRRRLVQAERHV